MAGAAALLQVAVLHRPTVLAGERPLGWEEAVLGDALVSAHHFFLLPSPNFLHPDAAAAIGDALVVGALVAVVVAVAGEGSGGVEQQGERQQQERQQPQPANHPPHTAATRSSACNTAIKYHSRSTQPTIQSTTIYCIYIVYIYINI